VQNPGYNSPKNRLLQHKAISSDGKLRVHHGGGAHNNAKKVIKGRGINPGLSGELSGA